MSVVQEGGALSAVRNGVRTTVRAPRRFARALRRGASSTVTGVAARLPFRRQSEERSEDTGDDGRADLEDERRDTTEQPVLMLPTASQPRCWWLPCLRRCCLRTPSPLAAPLPTASLGFMERFADEDMPDFRREATSSDLTALAGDGPSVSVDWGAYVSVGCVGLCVEAVTLEDGVTKGRLQRHLIRNYYWSGSFVKDYAFFVANWHPFVGIVLCHPLHPWTKLNRLGMLLYSCSFTYLVIVSRFGDDAVMDYIVLLLWVTLPAMIVETLLYQLMTLPTRFKDRAVCCCHCLMLISKGLKRYCLFLAIITGLVVFIWGSYAAERYSADERKQFLVALAMSRLQSALIWFPLNFVMPCIGFFPLWRAERRKHLFS